jgi:hypothetical protein
MDRRQVFAASMALAIAAVAASRAHGQPQFFASQHDPWRTIAITTHIEIPGAAEATQASLPIPGVGTD